MAMLEIIEVEPPDPTAKPTGRFRWWRPLEGEPELQQEWLGRGRMCVWLPIPIHAEMEESSCPTP